MLTLSPPLPSRRRPARKRSAFAVLASAALLALLTSAPGADQAAPGVRLSIEPARVWVEGRGVRVSEALAALGARAGFTVSGLGASPVVEHLSVEGETVADVVRQLLRHEDHAVVYREEATSPSRHIDTIVLLGRRAPVAPNAESPAGRSGDVRSLDAHGIAERPAAAGSLRPSAASEIDGMSDRAPAASRVGSPLDVLLRAHALPGSLPEPAEDQYGAPATPVPVHGTRPAEPPPGGGELTRPGADQQEALAAATRAAQENLRSLIDSLEAASRSMLQPLPPSR
jgi:hypothetical protein